jgi:hypothetical protein
MRRVGPWFAQLRMTSPKCRDPLPARSSCDPYREASARILHSSSSGTEARKQQLVTTFSLARPTPASLVYALDMSKVTGRWQLRFLAMLVSGCVAACGRTTESDSAPELDGASGADAFAGAPDAGQQDGGSHATVGDADGAAGNTGGAAGDADGGPGDVGDSAGDADAAAGEAGGGARTAGDGDAKGTVVEPYFRAGSRLKPRVIRAGDLEVLDGDSETEWHDAKTGDPCVFRVGADGIERCFPANMIDDSTESSVISYLDAACTRRAVRDFYHCDGAAPHYLTIAPASTCNYRTYRFGATLPSTTPLYQKSGTACRRVPASTDANTVLPIEEEVPPETFVAVKRVSRPRHPRMNAWVREGEDGSSEIIGFSEPAHDAPCFGLALDVSPQVCVPAWLETWNFSDAACTQRVGIEDIDTLRCLPRSKTTTLLSVIGNAGSCPASRSITGLWQIAGVSSSAIFDNSSGVCDVRSSEPTAVHTQGAPIDLASLPKLELIEVGTGPLKLAFFGFEGMPFMPAPRSLDSYPHPGQFIDAARGETCYPRIFADGVWRCVPASFQSVMDFNFLYESGDCTGARTYDATMYCEDPTRKPRGVIVQSLLPSVCRDYLVTETLELDGPTSQTVVSRHGLSSMCSTLPVSDRLTPLRVSKELNPADVFVKMDRVVKD